MPLPATGYSEDADFDYSSRTKISDWGNSGHLLKLVHSVNHDTTIFSERREEECRWVVLWWMKIVVVGANTRDFQGSTTASSPLSFFLQVCIQYCGSYRTVVVVKEIR